MSWWMGASWGFLRGGPLGALVGGAIQHFFTKQIQKGLQKSLPGLADPGLFALCLATVTTRVGMAKGGDAAEDTDVAVRVPLELAPLCGDDLAHHTPRAGSHSL